MSTWDGGFGVAQCSAWMNIDTAEPDSDAEHQKRADIV